MFYCGHWCFFRFLQIALFCWVLNVLFETLQVTNQWKNCFPFDLNFLRFYWTIFCVFVWWCLTPLSIIFQLSWRSVLLMEEIRENHWPITDKLYHIMLYTSPWSRFKLTTSVVIGTNCIGTTIRSWPRRPLYWTTKFTKMSTHE